MIRLIDRVGAKVRNSALYHRLIFIRRAFKTVIARKFPKPFAYERYSKVAICIEHEHAAWIRTKRLVLATIRAHTDIRGQDRKSTRLNSSYLGISYAVFCLKKKNKGIL